MEGQFNGNGLPVVDKDSFPWDIDVRMHYSMFINKNPEEWVLLTRNLEKQATQLKKTAPDEAIRLLREAETIERNNNPNATGQSQRLHIATILYEARRFNGLFFCLENNFFCEFFRRIDRNS